MIFPFDKIISLNKALFMHALEYGYNLDSFDNIWQNNSVRNITQDLRNTGRYILPFMQIEQAPKFPIYFPKVWNDLKDVRLQRNRTTFKLHSLMNSLKRSRKLT